jgi:hypothetical protein
MNADDFNALRKEACDLFNAQPAKDKLKISLDAIFVALASETGQDKGSRAKNRKTSEDPPPAWFTETLDKLKGKGERVTVGRFLLLAGQFPATRSDSLNTSRWLREAGYTPRKTGGNLLFEL